ncbi:hypothetical protein ABZV14_02465 [Streptosporangium canum]|uniref:hypothetical protein n=1 Tax=Streptosporangium canum TaxID=324952 RepID=UPI0033A7691D
MIGNPRTPGRHRAGLAPTVVPHRLWDGPARAEAERLDDAWPGRIGFSELGGGSYDT